MAVRYRHEANAIPLLAFEGNKVPARGKRNSIIASPRAGTLEPAHMKCARWCPSSARLFDAYIAARVDLLVNENARSVLRNIRLVCRHELVAVGDRGSAPDGRPDRERATS
jgi:hypothetical protein